MIDGFRGSIAASALASDFGEIGEIIADEDGSLAVCATAELVKSEQPTAIVAQESPARILSAGFTPQLDADPGSWVVGIESELPYPTANKSVCSASNRRLVVPQTTLFALTRITSACFPNGGY